MIVDEQSIRRTLDIYKDHMTGDAELANAVRARARSDRRKRLAVVGGVMSAVLLVGAAWVLEAQTVTSSDVASDTDPPGKVVGERLGLEPVAFPGQGCEQWVGYDHDWGYCLDGVTENETELVLLSQEVMGYEMTEARVAYVTAIIEMGEYWRPETPEDKAKAAELEQIADQARPLLEPLYQPIDLASFEGLTGESLAAAAGLIPTKGVPHVGIGSWGIEVGGFLYDLDGVPANDEEAEDWASRLSGRDAHREVMPDVVGMDEDQAIDVLEATGFADVRVHRVASTEPEGIVTYQLPKAGDTHPRAFWISIDVSNGNTP